MRISTAVEILRHWDPLPTRRGTWGPQLEADPAAVCAAWDRIWRGEYPVTTPARAAELRASWEQLREILLAASELREGTPWGVVIRAVGPLPAGSPAALLAESICLWGLVAPEEVS